jgi:type IV pilus assembly protein PilC
VPTYHYEMSNAAGQPVRGSASASSLPALAMQLADQGWRVDRVLADPTPAPFRYWRRVSTPELTNFYRQVAVMLRNHVPVPEAIALLARECRNPVLQTILYQVEGLVRAGEPLSASLAHYPRLFGPMHTATLESGEASNSLERVSERLADYADSVRGAIASMRSASVYPLTVCFATATLMTCTFVFIVPKYAALMKDLGVKEFPLLTQALMFCSQWALPVVALVVMPPALLAAITLGIQRGQSPWALDALRLRVPVLGRLFGSLALFRLSAMLSVFLDGKTPLLDALRLAGQASDNAVVQGAVWDAIPRVAAGEPLGRALDETGVLPADFCGQVSVAQENGDLPGTLHRLSRWHAERMELLASNIGKAVEPVLIVFIGICVGAIALGLFWPLVQIIRNLTASGGSD